MYYIFENIGEEMVDYVESLKYPLLNPKNFLIGFILSIFWWALVPLFFIFGYMVETTRETLQKSNKLPHWATLENWKKFLKHGVMVFLILAVYMIPPLALSVASSTIMGNPMQTIISGGTPTLNALGMSLMLLSSFLVLAAAFLLPMAIVLYSASEDIRYAISIAEILPRIRRAIIPYLKAYAVSALLFIAIFFLAMIPVVGLLLGGLLFYPLLFSARLFAEVFRDYE